MHQGGVPADIGAIRQVCEPLKIAIVEDAACALGSTYQGAPIGSHSDFVAYSFHPRKVITTGEGGMLVTRRTELVGRIRRLRDHGMSISAAQRHQSRTPIIEQYLETGFNYRISDIQAAVGIVQLGRLDAIVARRRQLALRYQRRLAGVPGLSVVSIPLRHHQLPVVPDLAPRRLPHRTRRSHEHYDAMRHFSPARIHGVSSPAAYAGASRGKRSITERPTRQSTNLLRLFHRLTETEQHHHRRYCGMCRPSPGRGRLRGSRENRRLLRYQKSTVGSAIRAQVASAYIHRSDPLLQLRSISE